MFTIFTDQVLAENCRKKKNPNLSIQLIDLTILWGSYQKNLIEGKNHSLAEYLTKIKNCFWIQLLVTALNHCTCTLIPY